jgi:bifunctional DNA-binding transcriptional regulator/antitoxin component of YhaV-PrlF toxin-antitoxin module
VTNSNKRSNTRKPRVKAKAVVRRDRHRSDSSACSAVRCAVPAEVRAALNLQLGDYLIWEEGCDAAVQDAMLRGKYFVVRVERIMRPETQQTQPRSVPDVPPDPDPCGVREFRAPEREQTGREKSAEIDKQRARRRLGWDDL